MSKQKYPLPDHEWEAMIYCVIDGQNGDEENMEACEAIERIRDERAALIKMLDDKPKRKRTKK